MTVRPATDPGPRIVALHRVTSVRAVLAIAVAVAFAAAACGPGLSAASERPAAGSGAVLGPATSPAAAPGSAAPGSAGPGDSVPRWPGTTVLATIALGAADGEIQKAGNDLQAAANAQDLRAMWGAADGLARMIDALMPNIDRLEVYDGTRPVAKLYRVAFPELSAGAKQLRDAITSGDAAGIVAGSQAIAKGLADYSPIREQIAALVEVAIVQQRLLTR